jgi:hypothetical protein
MMEMVKAAREGRLTRVIGVAAAALWMGSAGMLIVPRTVHAQDDSAAVSSDNADVNDNSDVADDTDSNDGADADPYAVSLAVPPTIAGQWTGTADDGKLGNGTVTITLIQANKVVAATVWEIDFGANSIGGQGSGKIAGKKLTLKLDDPTTAKKCRVKFTGKVTAVDGTGTEITGKYSITKCFAKNSKGTITLAPVAQ